MIGLVYSRFSWGWKKSSLLVLGLLIWAVPAPSDGQQTGASLTISPNAGAFEVGSLVDISFVLDTGGEAVNAVNADITFPADKLQVVNPAASTSFITIWVTAPTFSNTDGTITFQGGLPNPGIKTSAGVISTVTFRVKSSGTATLRYQPTSQVLRNDGEGTNILTATATAELTLKNAPPAGPVVHSPSHPDSNQWSNNNTVQLTWENEPGVTGYSYVFDQNPKTVPDEEVDTTNSSVGLTANADGVWYFHLRAKSESWGGTTTFTARIDSTPPAAFTPEISPRVATTEETTILRFLTTDSASGIDHYEVKQVFRSGLGGTDTLFIEATSPYTIQPLPAGEYQFIVRAFDRAGNVSEGTIGLQAAAAGLSFFARVPLLRNPAVANTVLIVLGTLVFLLISWLILRRARLRATFRHDLQRLEKDAQKKAAALQQELDEIREAEAMIHGSVNQVPPPQPPPPPSPPPTVAPPTPGTPAAQPDQPPVKP